MGIRILLLRLRARLVSIQLFSLPQLSFTETGRFIYEVIDILEVDRRDANRARRAEGGKPETEGIA